MKKLIEGLGCLYEEFSLRELKIGLITAIKLHKKYGFTKTDVENLIEYYFFGAKEEYFLKTQWFYNDFKYETAAILFPNEYCRWLEIENNDWEKLNGKVTSFSGPEV